MVLPTAPPAIAPMRAPAPVVPGWTVTNSRITLDGNSSNINGASTYTGVANNNKSAELIWLGATIGWLVVGGIPG